MEPMRATVPRNSSRAAAHPARRHDRGVEAVLECLLDMCPDLPLGDAVADQGVLDAARQLGAGQRQRRMDGRRCIHCSSVARAWDHPQSPPICMLA